MFDSRNRAFSASLFGIVFLYFIAYFVIFYTVLPSGEPVKGQLQSLINYANNEKWEDAQNTLEDLNNTWNRVKFLVALNYAEAEYPVLLEYLGRLKASVEAKDASQVETDAAAALALWKNFIKIIPEP